MKLRSNLCSALVLSGLLLGCSSKDEPTDGGMREGGGRDAAIPGGGEPCTPGARLLVACRAECGVGSCTGDPVLRVCDGTVTEAQCAALELGDPLLLNENDDSSECGGEPSCPASNVVCPASGSIRVVDRAFGSDPFTCDWAVRAEGTDAGPPPPPPEDMGVEEDAFVPPPIDMGVEEDAFVPPPVDMGVEEDAFVPTDAGPMLPPTSLRADCRITTTAPECGEIGTGDALRLIGSSPEFGVYVAATDTFFINGSSAIMRVERATGARTIISGEVDDPATGLRTVGTGPSWGQFGLISIRRRADGQLIAMASDGFYVVDPATGTRSFLRDYSGVPSANTVRVEGRFAIGPSNELYVVITRGTSGSGVGIVRLEPTTGGMVVTLSGAVDSSRNRGTGVSYDVAGYEAVEYFDGMLWVLNFDDDNLMRVDPATGNRVIVSDESRGGLPVGDDTDDYEHSIAGGSLVLDSTDGIALTHSTRIELSSGDRRYASPYFRDIIEARHPWNAIGSLFGIAIHYDPANDLVYEVTESGVRVSELQTGNYNYITYD